MLVGATAAVAETENNNTRDTANPITVGVAGAHNSAIMPAADVDWYRFEAKANVTYTVEVLNVDPAMGLYLSVYDASGRRLQNWDSYYGNGNGNVYVRLQVTPTIAQTLFVRVTAESATQTGAYTVRVLPDYANGLTWDASGEPDDVLALARPIGVGVGAAIRASLYPRGNYAVQWGDADSYRFEAKANVTYTVEVLNVDPGMQLNLAVYNSSGTRLQNWDSYYGNGNGNVYVRLQVKPTIAQTLFVRVTAESATQAGAYTVRVLPDYANGLTRDSAGEPDDMISLARAATIGLPTSWTIEPRNPQYNAVWADRDVFRWTAEAGKTYTITAAAPGFRTNLSVYDSAGTRVTYDTYCEAGKGCSLTISPTITQVYSAMATAYNDDASGAYAICVSGAGQTCRTFWDVPAGTQFYNEISWLAFRGITTGYQDGSYKPVQPINRDAMAAFLYRLAGSPAFTPTKQTFVDVPRGAQFYKEIEWLATKGITSGWDTPRGKEYRPVSPIGRDAMAAFLYRLKGQPAFAPSKQTFTDVTRTTQFYKEIEWMASTKITTGYPDNTYRPTAQVGRDAMAAFLYRYVQLFGDPGAR